ncbi:ABCC12 [Cordylochernes scorpioides]|uniref:ABCC12 n=1 Tax=Cordylochernes scorpioides TaxID=51811 RepID=A0ABY6KMT4_9ARAC|nr:ABCC12 [Cordylochernes scorpioides]
MLPKYPAVNGPLTLSPEDGLEKSSSVSRGTYTIYIAAAGGLIMAAMVTLWFILQGSLAVFANWWLSHWLDKGSGIMIDQNATAPEEINILDNPDLDFYQTIYGLTAGLLITCSLVMGFLFTKCSLRATNVLHHQLFWKLCHCPMNFFDMVPTGRILNLFTRDLEEGTYCLPFFLPSEIFLVLGVSVDCQLPPVLYQLLQKAVLVALKVLVMIVVFPYSLPGLVLVAALFGLLYTSFRSAVRSLKRLEATHRAPLLSLLLESLQGLSVIQAFHKQEDFRNWFSNLVDKYSAPLYLYECSLRWMIARIDLLCTAVTLTVCLVAVFTRDSVTSGLAALAIVYAVQVDRLVGGQITSQLYMVGRQAVTCESHFTAVERIHTYMAELEGEPGGKAEPPLDWPTRGRLLFHDVTLRYRPGLPLALKGVSFELQPGDRVAVVGHSGAGKSSLGAALFRLVELSSGTIFLDGVDISTLRVEALRAAMAIIPQDPVLFQGTIRYNLDPLQVHEDEELWDALERTHIKDKLSECRFALVRIKWISQLNGLVQVTSLNLAVQEGGVNFSVGEKQLLSMARALLSKSKVVVLDEATASIDPATDDLIQSTITEVFKDCTVLAIAHRLSTVQHYPKVLVMQDGKVMEFDSTQTLFDNPHSAFSQLMASFSTN